MDKEELVKTLKILIEGLENAKSNEELDKLKDECKSWKNAYFDLLTVSIMLYKKLCVSFGDLAYFSTEDFQRTVQRLRQFDDPTLIEDTKLLFKEITGEEYIED